mgnify:CR=1 FL=1
MPSFQSCVAFLITNLNTMPADVGGFLALRVSVKNLLLTAVFSFAWTSVLRAFGLYEKRTHRQSGLRLVAASACASVFALLFVILTSRAGTFKINAVLSHLDHRPVADYCHAFSVPTIAGAGPDEPASSSGADHRQRPARAAA